MLLLLSFMMESWSGVEGSRVGGVVESLFPGASLSTCEEDDNWADVNTLFNEIEHLRLVPD